MSRGRARVWIAPTVAALAFVAALAVFVVALVYYNRWIVEWSGNDLRSRAEMTAAALAEPLRTLDYKALDAVAARLREERLRLRICAGPRFFVSEGDSLTGFYDTLRSLTPASRRFLRSANIYFVAHGIHSRKYEYMPRTLVNAVKCYLRVKLERWIYRRCRRVVVLTRSDEAKARELYGLDLELVVESNTLDGWVAPNMEQTFKGERYSHVYIGRFCFQKGQDIWIRKMAEGSVDGRTLFIGAGETLDECKLLARRLGIYDRCSFAGEIEGAERYLKCADCVVSASRWEGMPYLMMKARSLGCRILATDCPGNRDVLKGYSNATMFPVEDADAPSGLLCSCHAN